MKANYFGSIKSRRMAGGVIMIFIALLFLLPLFLVIMNSFKSNAEYMGSIIAFPKSLYLENYKYIFREIDYAQVYLNSIIIEAISIAGIILVSSAAASKVSRHPGKFSSLIYYLLLLCMIIPFQARMLPLMSVVGIFKMSNSLWGMSLMHIATLSPPVFFMYSGAMKTVPVELEEAARIDGAGHGYTYFRIVLPLLSPMTMTVCVLYGLVVWNSFLLPMLMLTKPGLRTIPLVIYKFYGTYGVYWVALFAAIIIGSLPIFIVFMFLQKYVVSGVTAGGVKG